MNYLLLFISVFTDTLRNIYNNHFSKEMLDSPKDAVLFNIICGVGAVIFFIASGAEWQISGFSMAIAAIFAAVTAVAQYMLLMAMASGSMSYSVLFTYLGMVIPTFFGIVYYGQPLSVMGIIGLVLMIVTIFLGVDFKTDSQMSPKWLLYAIGNFIMWGIVGICQQIHQNSEFAGEINGFLMYSFIIMTAMYGIIFLIMPKKENHSYGYLKGKTLPIILISGIFLGVINKINLYLSGAMESIIFFPIVNGGVIILSGIAAIAIFREKLNKKQILGIITGIISVCLLGI